MPGVPAPESSSTPAPCPAQGRLDVATEPGPEDEGGCVTRPRPSPGVDPFPRPAEGSTVPEGEVSPGQLPAASGRRVCGVRGHGGGLRARAQPLCVPLKGE